MYGKALCKVGAGNATITGGFPEGSGLVATMAGDLNEAATFSYHPEPPSCSARKGSLGCLKVICLWGPRFNQAVFRPKVGFWLCGSFPGLLAETTHTPTPTPGFPSSLLQSVPVLPGSQLCPAGWPVTG